jgi:hypothetical protein
MTASPPSAMLWQRARYVPGCYCQREPGRPAFVLSFDQNEPFIRAFRSPARLLERAWPAFGDPPLTPARNRITARDRLGTQVEIDCFLHGDPEEVWFHSGAGSRAGVDYTFPSHSITLLEIQ